jgi:hypothetical protein
VVRGPEWLGVSHAPGVCHLGSTCSGCGGLCSDLAVAAVACVWKSICVCALTLGQMSEAAKLELGVL